MTRIRHICSELSDPVQVICTGKVFSLTKTIQSQRLVKLKVILSIIDSMLNILNIYEENLKNYNRNRANVHGMNKDTICDTLDCL